RDRLCILSFPTRRSSDLGDRVLEVGEHVFHRRFEQLLPSKGGRARVGIPHEPDEGLNVFRRQAPHVNPPLLGYPVPSLSGASRRDRGMPVKREKLRARRRTIGDRRNSTGITGNGIASQSTASVIGLFLQYDPETCPLSRANAAKPAWDDRAPKARQMQEISPVARIFEP